MDLPAHVLVVGMARSGLSAARALSERGVHVLINDQKTAYELHEVLDALPNGAVEECLGQDPISLLERVEMVVISPGVPDNAPIVTEAKARQIPVIGELELAYQICPGSVVAITGTNGKTTTTALTAEIFKNCGKISYAVGNIGVPWTSIADSAKPEDVIVVEVSSFQLESIETFRPQIAAILNISEDHIVRHGTMEAYIALKERIFENQGAKDALVLNYDDPITRSMAEKARSQVIFFSRLSRVPGGVYVSDGNIVCESPEGERVLCPIEEIRIPGKHNLENALAASAIALRMGVPYPVIRHTLRTFAGVEHRIELVREIDGIRFINDSKGTNVDATIKAIEAMSRPTVILLGGYDKKTDFTPLAKALKGSKVEKVVALGQTKDQILKALHDEGFEETCSADTFDQAVRTAFRTAKSGWSVLLSPACASYDMFNDFEQRGQVFKEIVQSL